MMFYATIIIVVLFLLFFPYIHVGGNYYRGLLIIYYKYYLTSSGFIKLTPDIPILKIVRWANPFTFRHIERDYAKDSRYIYAGGHRLDNSDPKTFRRIDAPVINEKSRERYYIDKNTVRCGEVLQMKILQKEQPPENFDTETFEPLGAGFVRDKTGVYYSTASSSDNFFEKNRYQRNARIISINCPLEIVDAKTFVIFELSSIRCRARDKNFIYEIGHFRYQNGVHLKRDGVLEIIEVLSDEPFEDLGARYYKTSRGIFFSDKQISEVDSQTFEVIAVNWNKYWYPYAKDKNHVYYLSRKLKDADPKTFQIIETSPFLAFDKANRYIQGNKISDYDDSIAQSKNSEFEQTYKKWKES